MIKGIRWCCVVLVATMGMGLQAMTLEREGDTLFATGALGGDDFGQFRHQLQQPGLRRLVLVDSPGGDIWTALKVGEMVRDAQLETVAVGNCLSACTLLFVAGNTRAFGVGRHPGRTVLGIHGPHSTDTRRVSHRASPAMYAFYRRQLGAAMDDGTINEAIYGIKDASGFLLLPEIERNPKASQAARFCASLQSPMSACKVHDGKDAFTLSVVTQRETVQVVLPPAMQWRLSLMGEAIDAPETDTAAHIERLHLLMCGAGACPGMADLIQKWATYPAHRAIAVTQALAGVRSNLAFSGNATSPDEAVARAIYQCNHRGSRVALCELVVIDNHDVHGLTERWLYESRQAARSLPEAQASAVVQENSDHCSAREVDRRKPLEEGGYDMPAPCSLKGVQRLDSRRLVDALHADEPPVLVDVSTDARMLPGALTLLNAGLSFADQTTEAAFHKRFEDLLWAAAPDFGQPLVFYADARGGWLSAHAALRAVQVGYLQVFWFRGGLPALQSAGLPTTPKVVQGVVH